MSAHIMADSPCPAARSGALRAAAALVILLPMGAGAQPLAGRVAAVRNGTVEMTFASRDGVCGDGRGMVGFDRTLRIWPNTVVNGEWSGARCVPGPIRMRLTLHEGSVTAARVFVGGDSAAPTTTTRLGSVPAADAAAYLVDLARHLDGRPGEQALLGAALADSVDISGELSDIAHDRAQPTKLRTTAIWLLATATDGVGVPSVIQLAGDTAEPRIGKQAIFWLGQAHDPRARSALETLISNEAASVDRRSNAIFALGQDDDPAVFTYLRDLYPQLSDARLKKQLIFVCSQRDDPEATTALIHIAQTDPDLSIRKNAMFWLGQRHDQRAVDFIRDILSR